MKIWILNHYAVSPDSIGGTRHYDFAKELVRRGYEVTVFASSFNHFEKQETLDYHQSIYKKINYNGVNFVWIKTPRYNNSIKRLLNILVFSYRLNKVLNKLLQSQSPDLIIGSSVHPLTPLVGLKKAKKKGIKFYFEERDLWPQTFIDFGVLTLNNPITKILFRIEKHLYKHSDRVIFLFENASKYAIKHGLDEKKALYLPNGYSEDRIKEKKKSQAVEKIINGIKDKKLCVYIGSMGEANYMQPLLKLAHLMKEEKEYYFLFVGNGEDKNSLIKYKKYNGLENVSFFNPIPKKDIPILLEYAHCGLISIKNSPLYKWGFSMNKIYDYLSMGLPILMYSNIEDIGKLKDTNAILKADTEEELKKYLLNDLNYFNREEIKKITYENYSWERLTEKFLKNID